MVTSTLFVCSLILAQRLLTVPFQLHRFQPFYSMRCHPPVSSALPFLSEEPVTTQQGTPVAGLVPPVSLMPMIESPWHWVTASWSPLLLPQAAFIGNETFHEWYFVANTCEAHLQVPFLLLSSSFGIQCHCSSLASLVFSHSLSQTSLKLCQRALLAPGLELLFPSENG